MTEKSPTWEEILKDGLDDAKSMETQAQLVANNPQINQTVNMNWIQVVFTHIQQIYRIEKELMSSINETNDLLKRLLSADKSVPREELESRAELLGLFVRALINRTQGASP